MQFMIPIINNFLVYVSGWVGNSAGNYLERGYESPIKWDMLQEKRTSKRLGHKAATQVVIVQQTVNIHTCN